jgi:hypothetical protein
VTSSESPPVSIIKGALLDTCITASTTVLLSSDKLEASDAGKTAEAECPDALTIRGILAPSN